MFTLEQAMKAQRGNSGIALLFLNLIPTSGWVVNAMPRLVYPWEGDPVPNVQEAGWAPWLSGWVWKISPPPEFDPQSV
jgi:hypothetical protein